MNRSQLTPRPPGGVARLPVTATLNGVDDKMADLYCRVCSERLATVKRWGGAYKQAISKGISCAKCGKVQPVIPFVPPEGPLPQR